MWESEKKAVIEVAQEMERKGLVVGTAALKRPDWFAAMSRSQPGHLVLGIDARDGRVASNGWTETSDQTATDLAVLGDKGISFFN